MQKLTQGQGVWKHQPSMGDFTNFQMHSLTPMAKVWYNFLCVKIKPTLHLSIVTKDKTILLYAMTKGFQFDIGSVIERGLIESTQGRCTRALILPSLITQLCRLVEVLMLDSEEQEQQCLPIPLPKENSRARAIRMRRPTMMLQQPHLVRVILRAATLRPPLVLLSPWQTRFMRSTCDLTHIGISLRSIVLP